VIHEEQALHGRIAPGETMPLIYRSMQKGQRPSRERDGLLKG
jgi:hypothetical protein